MENIEHDNLRRSIRKDIYDLVRKINHTKSIDNYCVLENDIKGYFHLAHFLEIDVDDIINKIYNLNIPDNNLNIINRHYKNCKNSLDLDTEICRNIINIYLNSPYHETEFSEYINKTKELDTYNIVFDFLNEYNQNLANKLNNLINEKRIVFVEDIGDISEGAFICSNYKFSPYILIEEKQNIVDASTLVHEIGHFWHYEHLFKTSYRNYINCTMNSTFEVIPYVNELIFFDYLQKIDFQNKDILNLKRKITSVFLEFNNLLGESLKKFNKRNFLDEYDDYEFFYSYARGMLLAFEFRDIYLKDIDFFNYNIKKFIDESSNYDFLTLINKCGLNREKIESGESIKKYIKEIF